VIVSITSHVEEVRATHLRGPLPNLDARGSLCFIVAEGGIFEIDAIADRTASVGSRR
jgi:hypothetical protein